MAVTTTTMHLGQPLKLMLAHTVIGGPTSLSEVSILVLSYMK